MPAHFARFGLLAAIAVVAQPLMATVAVGQTVDVVVSATLAAGAQSDNPFSALVGKKRERSNERRRPGAVERYVLTSDDRMFLFEERDDGARVQFLCGQNDPRIDCMLDIEGPAPEIYDLSATRAPRGDVIYKNALDDTLLRIAAYGGATVFWPGDTRGTAASKSFGDDHSLTLAFADRETAIRRAQGAAAQISAAVGVPVFFDIGAADKTPGANAAVLADAIVTTAKGFARVAQDEVGAQAIASRLNRVVFLPSTDPEISLGGSVLEIRYVPNLDIAGRPSSAQVAQFLEESL